MGAVLIQHWLAGAVPIAVVDEASISLVREAVRRTSRLPELALEKLVTATSELARNQLVHATGGVIAIVEIERDGVAGLEVIAADRGGGIPDPATALQGSPRATGSLGVGLSAAARQVDELDLDIRRGSGTCIRLRSFERAVRRSEVGILAQPHPEERVIGDHAIALRDGSGLLLGVVDGLGHGSLARDASDRAIAEVLRHPEVAPADQLAAIHAQLSGTRGGVMSLARVTSGIEHAGVGNVSTRLLAHDGSVRPFTSTAGTLGSVLPRRIHVEHVERPAGAVLVMYSDGLKSRVDLADELPVLRQHPIAIAQALLARFGRGTDDALVVVAR